MRFSTRIAPLALGAMLVTPSVAFAGDGSSLLRYLPSGMRAVAAVDVDELRGAPIFAQMTSVATQTSEYQEFLAAVGGAGALDPVNNVHTIVAGSTVVDDSESADHAVFLIEATFTQSALEAALGGQADVVRGAVGTIPTFTRGGAMLAILSPSLLAYGDAELVAGSAAVAAGTGSGGLGPTVGGHAGRAAGGTAWFATMAPDGEDDFVSARGQVTITSSVSGSVTAVAASAEAAAALVTQINTDIGTLSADPNIAMFGLQGVVQSIRASASGADVTVNATVDAGTWGTLTTTLVEIIRSEL